jgi:hypothetical protein
MAFTLLQRKKIQQGLILVLIAVLFITATVLWMGFFKKGPVSLGEPQAAVIPQVQPVEINFGVLSLPLLQELDVPGQPVLEPELKGRSNPFLPF